MLRGNIMSKGRERADIIWWDWNRLCETLCTCWFGEADCGRTVIGLHGDGCTRVCVTVAWTWTIKTLPGRCLFNGRHESRLDSDTVAKGVVVHLVCYERASVRSWRGQWVQCVVLYFIGDIQGKVGMIQSFPHSYALRGVECEKFLNEVEKLPVYNVSWWYNILKWTFRRHSFGRTNVRQCTYREWTSGTDILFALSWRLWFRPVEFCALLEELGFGPGTSTSKAIRHLAHHHLHHCEMF